MIKLAVLMLVIAVINSEKINNFLEGFYWLCIWNTCIHEAEETEIASRKESYHTKFENFTILPSHWTDTRRFWAIFTLKMQN